MKEQNEHLALHGGKPVRATTLRYGRQWIDDEDVEVVTRVLRSDWLTTGPMVVEFERAFAEFVGVREAVSVSSGTAGLHAALHAIGIGKGDEVILSPMTFAATANSVLYQGGTPVFADVEAETLLLDPAEVERKITSRTKAILAMDYAGQPCDYDALRAIAGLYGLVLVADACHSLGSRYKGRRIGSLADLNVFSFHPVKPITTGEGGLVTTDDPDLARRLRMFRNHGISLDVHERQAQGSWFYEMVSLGYNYRLSDIHCALGITQLKKLNRWLERRMAIASCYHEAFKELPEIEIPFVKSDRESAWHLYVILLNIDRLRAGRSEIFKALRAENIGVNVHYIPVSWHPYYQKLGYKKGQWPIAENAYERLLSLPMYPAMTDDDVRDVIHALKKVVLTFRK